MKTAIHNILSLIFHRVITRPKFCISSILSLVGTPLFSTQFNFSLALHFELLVRTTLPRKNVWRWAVAYPSTRSVEKASSKREISTLKMSAFLCRWCDFCLTEVVKSPLRTFKPFCSSWFWRIRKCKDCHERWLEMIQSAYFVLEPWWSSIWA